jgi:hypothetical protein
MKGRTPTSRASYGRAAAGAIDARRGAPPPDPQRGRLALQTSTQAPAKACTAACWLTPAISSRESTAPWPHFPGVVGRPHLCLADPKTGRTQSYGDP